MHQSLVENEKISKIFFLLSSLEGGGGGGDQRGGRRRLDDGGEGLAHGVHPGLVQANSHHNSWTTSEGRPVPRAVSTS